MSTITKVFLVLLAIVILLALAILVLSAGVLLVSSFVIGTGYITSEWLFKDSISLYQASLLNLISVAIFIFLASLLGLWAKISRMANHVSAIFDEDYDEDYEDDYDDEDYDEEFDEEEGERKTIKPNWTGKDVSRNQKCPCGSGKKFKNCCGRYL